MNEPFIGGDLDAIAASGGKLVDTGTEVLGCGEKIKGAATDLNTEITAAMTRVMGTFGTVSTELMDSIAAGKASLEGTTWGGNSAQVATDVEIELTAAVTKLDTEARERLQAEQNAFNERAALIMAEVGDAYHTLTGEIDGRYKALGNAAQTTAANFAEADKTITIGA